MNPPGGVSPPGQTALDFKMEMPKAPGQLQASKTWPEDVPEPVDPTKPTVNSPPRQKSTFEKMKDWSRAAGQTTEAMMEDMFEPSFDNLDEAKSSYNKGDLAGASAAVGMAAVGMVDPTKKGKAVKRAVSGGKGKKVAKNKENGKGVAKQTGRTKPTGKIGGKPTGKRAKINPKGDAATQRGHQLENDSADVLANRGYKVEQNPKVPGVKNPDYIIEGKVFDNKAPNGPRARNAASEIEKAVKKKQADRIVLNMEDAGFTPEEMKKQLDDWPVKGLKEVIVIKDGQVIPFWP